MKDNQLSNLLFHGNEFTLVHNRCSFIHNCEDIYPSLYQFVTYQKDFTIDL